MKGRNTRLHNATRAELWQRFQRPLNDLQLWKALAQRLLDITTSLPDLPSIHTFLPQIEAALTESSRLKEQLAMLQLKTDLLGSLFGQERAAALLEQVATSVRDRDLLHNSLLQRKSKLQSLLVQHKDFGVAFDPLHRKLLDLQARIQAEKGLQRDLPGKQVRLLRLQGLQEEGLDLGTQIEAVRPLAQGNLSHQHKVDQVSSDQQALQRTLEQGHTYPNKDTPTPGTHLLQQGHTHSSEDTTLQQAHTSSSEATPPPWSHCRPVTNSTEGTCHLPRPTVTL